jgi:hypothetical protein
VRVELRFVSLVGWASWESVVGGTGATSLGPGELSKSGADSARVELRFLSLVGWASWESVVVGTGRVWSRGWIAAICEGVVLSACDSGSGTV